MEKQKTTVIGSSRMEKKKQSTMESVLEISKKLAECEKDPITWGSLERRVKLLEEAKTLFGQNRSAFDTFKAHSLPYTAARANAYLLAWKLRASLQQQNANLYEAVELYTAAYKEGMTVGLH